jgi:hypothetical protein
VGWRDGWPVGRPAGCRDGRDVGWRDGWPLGRLVGCRDGCDVGVIAGCRLGCVVGWPEGCVLTVWRGEGASGLTQAMCKKRVYPRTGGRSAGATAARWVDGTAC